MPLYPNAHLNVLTEDFAPPPWWNDAMSEIKKKLNKAKRNFKRRSNQQNYDSLKSVEEEYKRTEEEQKDLWTDALCDKISNGYSPKEMWDSLRTLTSYQDLDGGNILSLLNDSNQPVFDLPGKCSILKIPSSVENIYKPIILIMILKFPYKKLLLGRIIPIFMTVQVLTGISLLRKPKQRWKT